MLDILPQKWDPQKVMLPDTDNEETLDDTAISQSARTAEVLADVFRVFTKGETTNEMFEVQEHDGQKNLNPIIVVTHGLCLADDDGIRAGARTYYGENDPRNSNIRLPPESLGQTLQNAELVAVKSAAVMATNARVLCIENSSPYMIKMLNVRLTKMEDEGYVAVRKRSGKKIFGNPQRPRCRKQA